MSLWERDTPPHQEETVEVVLASQCLLGASLKRLSKHIPLGGDFRADPKLAGGLLIFWKQRKIP